MTESPAAPLQLGRRSRLGLLALVVALPFAFALVALSYRAGFWTAMRSLVPEWVTGRAAAPDFSFTTFDDQRLAPGDLAGQAVVLNFWASWCAPCRTEMPDFESAYRANRDRGVTFVGLAVGDTPEAARAFLNELGISYPAGPDAGSEISLRYGVSGLPTTVFISRDGTITRRWLGVLNEQQLTAFVEEIAR
jgi:peroxiredoxin